MFAFKFYDFMDFAKSHEKRAGSVLFRMCFKFLRRTGKTKFGFVLKPINSLVP